MSATVRDNRGFSSLELLIGLGLLIAVVGIAYEFLTTGSKAAVITRRSFFAQSQTRAAIDNMTDEIRWADSITFATATSVTVTIPSNTPFSSGPYSVTFAYDATAKTITRQQDANPSAPIAFYIVKLDGTGGFSLDYYDKSSNALACCPLTVTPDVIGRVRVTVTATRESTSRLLTGDVTLRASP